MAKKIVKVRQKAEKKISEVSINADVWIYLTEYGKKWLASQHPSITISETGPIRFALWEFMQVFGPTFRMGQNDPKLFTGVLYFEKPTKGGDKA